YCSAAFEGLAKHDFFFQAEDGIRDFHVTGVQTCALPISRRDASPRCWAGRCSRASGAACPRPVLTWATRRGKWTPRCRAGPWCRSEERRVGKEGRSKRGWHTVKKTELSRTRRNGEGRRP